MIDVLTALTMTMRALAIVAGSLVFIESVKVLLTDHMPKRCPKKDAIVWAQLAATIAIGGTLLILYGEPTVDTYISIYARLVVLGIWSGLSLGLALRQSFARERPYYIWASVLIFIFAGTGLQVSGV